uniref:Unique cartilage matrix-associated protein n=1 Tax=Neogobius melanostomus TaxID=47308 RepID=A0A8C6UG20_9GOBI
ILFMNELYDVSEFNVTFLSVSIVLVESAAVDGDAKTEKQTGAGREVFMAESDASNFFKRRSKRSTYAERIAEQRVHIANSERRREYNEEQRDEHENYLEEDRDEQLERTREVHEQIREFHYDGIYPRSSGFTEHAHSSTFLQSASNVSEIPFNCTTAFRPITFLFCKRHL